jgi:hypothetical protein
MKKIIVFALGQFRRMKCKSMIIDRVGIHIYSYDHLTITFAVRVLFLRNIYYKIIYSLFDKEFLYK